MVKTCVHASTRLRNRSREHLANVIESDQRVVPLSFYTIWNQNITQHTRMSHNTTLVSLNDPLSLSLSFTSHITYTKCIPPSPSSSSMPLVPIGLQFDYNCSTESDEQTSVSLCQNVQKAYVETSKCLKKTDAIHSFLFIIIIIILTFNVFIFLLWI